jgi:hypothetical protein
MGRRTDLVTFYDLLARLERQVGGKRCLADCHGRMEWPVRGVYFFFEPGQFRSDTGHGLRVVRVGTHALNPGSRTTLWKRLSQHRGVQSSGGGNHRGSIFRLLVGAAIKSRDGLVAPSWDVGAHPGKAALELHKERTQILSDERPLEMMVSAYIRAMPFLWMGVDDAPGSKSKRGVIERNSIGLLSNYQRPPIDPASKNWLGSYSDRERVRRSGLWNNNHVDEGYDPAFLHVLERRVSHEADSTTGRAGSQ